jgi:hypothetical protein
MDLVSEAGIDVSDWGNWSGGPARAAANPKYCYEWSFVQPGKIVVLNVWYRNLREHGKVITMEDNLRSSAAMYRARRSGGSPVWRKRATAFDEAVRMAASQNLPVRAVICDGKMRSREDLNARASNVTARTLDPVPWAVTAYDSVTGQFTLTRGALPDHLIDQFSVGSTPESPTEIRSVTGVVFVRDPHVRAFALLRAAGRCEWCKRPGFTAHDGAVFLETHHVVPLGEGGADTVTNVVALCPNHHREAHYGAARDLMRERLLEALRSASEQPPTYTDVQPRGVLGGANA